MLSPIKTKATSAKTISKTDQASEIRRCIKDPAYLAKNYIYIKHKSGKAIKFKLWDFQEEALRSFRDNNKNIILKSRQMGITELMAMYILWFTLFSSDKNVIVVSKNARQAAQIIKRIKYAYKKLPAWLRVSKMVSDNVHTIEFANDSIIFADATTEHAGRGEACSLFVVDEAAFIPVFEEMWGSVEPTVNNGGACIIASTPNGGAGEFYKLYTGAPQNGLNPIKIEWNFHPDRDEEWFESTKRSMSPKKFAQEYLCSFLLSGDTVVEGEDILRHEKSVLDPISEIGPERNVWIWKPYSFSHRYLIAADVARGDGEDFSTFVVIDADTLEIAAEYKGKIKVNKFAELLSHIGHEYGTCLVVVENNTFGLAVLVKLIEMKYPVIYGEEKGGKSHSEGHIDWDLDDVVPGFRTDIASRVLSVDKLEESFRLDKVITYSKRMIEELRNFIYENGKPQARKGANDDLVIALAIGLYVCSYVFGSRDSDLETTKRLLESIRRTDYAINYKTVQESGFKSEDNIYQENPFDPYSAVYKNRVVDFRWVMGQRRPAEKAENKGIDFLGTLR